MAGTHALTECGTAEGASRFDKQGFPATIHARFAPGPEFCYPGDHGVADCLGDCLGRRCHPGTIPEPSRKERIGGDFRKRGHLLILP